MFFVRPTRIFFPDPGDEKLCALTPVEGIPRLTLLSGISTLTVANQVKAVPIQTYAEGVSLVRRAVKSHYRIVFSYERFG
jgi:hypothetical protein